MRKPRRKSFVGQYEEARTEAEARATDFTAEELAPLCKTVGRLMQADNRKSALAACSIGRAIHRGSEALFNLREKRGITTFNWRQLFRRLETVLRDQGHLSASRHYLRSCCRLVELPSGGVDELAASGQLSLWHIFQLSVLPAGDRQNMLRRVLAESMGGKKLEIELVKYAGSTSRGPAVPESVPDALHFLGEEGTRWCNALHRLALSRYDLIGEVKALSAHDRTRTLANLAVATGETLFQLAEMAIEIGTALHTESAQILAPLEHSAVDSLSG